MNGPFWIGRSSPIALGIPDPTGELMAAWALEFAMHEAIVEAVTFGRPYSSVGIQP